jgi:cell wall-associated NlpC family hydrolase
VALKQAGQGDPLSLTALAKHGGSITDFLLGPKGHRGALGNLLTGKGGDTKSSGAVTGAAPQTGTKSAAKDQRAAIVATAQTQLGIAYQWGGPPILGQHTDCSGLAQAVLAKNGIHVGRTTYQQWRQGKPTMNPQPGDLVFFHMGPKGPEHVGVYIGNDQFIEDPHTGSSVRVSKLSTYPGYCGARTYVSDSASGGKAPVPVDLHGDVAPAGDKPKKTKTHRAAILTGTALLSHGVQLALAKASGTSGTDDDLAALKRARAELEKLQKTASKKEQVPIAKELASINRQINAINKATSDIDNAKRRRSWPSSRPHGRSISRSSRRHGRSTLPSRRPQGGSTLTRCSGRLTRRGRRSRTASRVSPIRC